MQIDNSKWIASVASESNQPSQPLSVRQYYTQKMQFEIVGPLNEGEQT